MAIHKIFQLEVNDTLDVYLVCARANYDQSLEIPFEKSTTLPYGGLPFLSVCSSYPQKMVSS